MPHRASRGNTGWVRRQVEKGHEPEPALWFPLWFPQGEARSTSLGWIKRNHMGRIWSIGAVPSPLIPDTGAIRTVYIR